MAMVVVLSSVSTTIRCVWLLSFLTLFMSQSCLADDQFSFNLCYLGRKLCPGWKTGVFSTDSLVEAVQGSICRVVLAQTVSLPQVESQPLKFVILSSLADDELTHLSASSNPDRSRKKHKTWIPIRACLSATAVVPLLAYYLWDMSRRNELFKGQQQNSQETGLILDLNEGRTGDDGYAYNLLQKENAPLLTRNKVAKYISVENKIGNQKESQDLCMFSFEDIMEATNTFSVENKVGEGGFGSIYKGLLPNGELIAVKRHSKTSGQGFEEFLNEIIFIPRFQHKNVVRLLGYCTKRNEMMLIYEYLANGSLDDVLFESSMGRRRLLEWKARISIIQGVAEGLLYLHEHSQLKIIYGDIKPGNILLDVNMNPKISDFGIARAIDEYDGEVTAQDVGTLSCLAPEFLQSGQYSIKSDVFSFGILLLEIVTGKKNNKFQDEIWNLWCEGKALDWMDPTLKESYNLIELKRCIHIGLLCVQVDPEKRPTMSSVVVMLASDDVKLPRPTQPAYVCSGNVSSSFQSSSNIEDVSIHEAQRESWGYLYSWHILV